MSLRALTAVWDHRSSEGGTLLVLLALADYADENGWSFPSIGTLAAKSRLSERATQYAIRDLASRSEIEIDEKGGPKGCNRYRLTLSQGGANSAPRNICTGANNDAGGANGDTGGCNLEQEGVQPTAPKPSRNHQEEPPQEPVAAADAREARTAAAAGHLAKAVEDGSEDGEPDIDGPLTVREAVGQVAFGHVDAVPPGQRRELANVTALLERDGYCADDVLDADEHWRRCFEGRTGRQPSSAKLTQVYQHCAEWRRATRPAGPLYESNAPPATLPPPAIPVEAAEWPEPRLAPLLEALGYTPATCPPGERLAADKLLAMAFRRGLSPAQVVEVARRIAPRLRAGNVQRVREAALEVDAMAVVA